jgi:hypothetical protein
MGMEKWRDLNGEILHDGDMIEDVERRVIGKVLMGGGLPYVLIYKEFRPDLLGYEPLDTKGPHEAYVRGLVTRHTKLWWWLHRYTLSVIVLQKAERNRRSGRFSHCVHYEPSTAQ